MENVRICYPETLFEQGHAATEPWVCVRTRPRWEKKFSRWLVSHQQAHFLPLTRRRTVSHRKVWINDVPLFPGYVFVNACSPPRGLANSPCVVRTLTPACSHDGRRLASQILTVYRLLQHQGVVEFEPEFIEGQWVRVLSGPLSGAVGQFICTRGQRKFLLRVDMLGVGASVDFPMTTDVEPL